jgi:type IV pilus assembly protein PilA
MRAVAVVTTGLIGILAAIAIPAYGNYSIRAQITEGLMAADSIKTAVVEAAAQGSPWSEINSKSLEVRTPVGLKYVQSIDVDHGAITISYGRNANQTIQGMKLILAPATNARGDVLWSCGTARVPTDAIPVIENSAKYTTVSNAYLPTRCRS